MSLPADMRGLLEPRAYPHPCADVELVETHISWVLLAGDFAYKIKKPVRFSFVDFSTLPRREHFCREELRCNRRFAPGLYLDVVPLTDAADGTLEVGGTGEPREWAVKMRRFPAEAQLDRLVEADRLDAGLLAGFGTALAATHRTLPARTHSAAEVDARILGPARANFDDIEQLGGMDAWQELLSRARAAMEAQASVHRGLFEERLETGWTRECHGDLHLSNLVRLEDGVVAFDCLEFNADLRWIDPQSDVAFVFMDCLVRGRADLAYAFVDAYLDASGDYQGARLLPFYAAYRSMVRAKVAALGWDQTDDPGRRARLAERFQRHLTWTHRRFAAEPGTLVLMCGLSGSGKSHLAQRLTRHLPALRLRSDVARKARVGMAPDSSARGAVDTGLYTPAAVDEVYDDLARVAADLLCSGENVIVDATFLDATRRRRFLELADGHGAAARIVFCDAPLEVLRARVERRVRQGDDPSDAGPEVLEAQRKRFDVPTQRTERVDTSAELTGPSLQALVSRILGRR